MGIRANLASQSNQVPIDHIEPDFYIDSNCCTLNDAVQQLAIADQADIPFIVWLVELPIARSRYLARSVSTGMIVCTRFKIEDMLSPMKRLCAVLRSATVRKQIGFINSCSSLSPPRCIPENIAFPENAFNSLIQALFLVDRYPLEI
ncbi:hypothetical protein ABN584_26435 [Gloeocapsa sp. BRSZ]